MKTNLSAAVILLAAHATGHAATLQIVGAPGQVANNSTNFILTFAPMQWVYTAPSFGSEAIRITGLSMRFDQMYSRQNFPGEVDWTLDPGFRLKLGVVNGLGSNVQADNRNATLTTVLAGPRTIKVAVGADQDQTKPWTIVFDFQTPFDYDPALGNLLVDANFVHGPQVPGHPGYFYTLTADAIYAGAFGRGIAPASATNNHSYNLPVAQFTYGEIPILSNSSGVTAAVPEPASWALMIIGFGLVGGALRRRAVQPAGPASNILSHGKARTGAEC